MPRVFFVPSGRKEYPERFTSQLQPFSPIVMSEGRETCTYSFLQVLFFLLLPPLTTDCLLAISSVASLQ